MICLRRGNWPGGGTAERGEQRPENSAAHDSPSAEVGVAIVPNCTVHSSRCRQRLWAASAEQRWPANTLATNRIQRPPVPLLDALAVISAPANIPLCNSATTAVVAQAPTSISSSFQWQQFPVARNARAQGAPEVPYGMGLLGTR